MKRILTVGKELVRMRKLPKLLRRVLKHAAGLISLGIQARSPRWLVLTLLNVELPITIKIGGISVTVRTATPDLEVAISCLCGEFDPLFAAIPTLRHHLIIDAGGYIGTGRSLLLGDIQIRQLLLSNPTAPIIVHC